MKNRKILKFIISISILILFIFEQIAYCMPNYTYEFTLRVPMHYGREHVRKDRTKEIREAIEDSDTVKLAEEIKIADSSALDYTIFISTVLRLIEKDTAFLEIVKAKMGKLKGHKSREICSLAGELENFLSDSLRLYKAIGYSNEEVFVYDSTAILADSVSVGRRGVGFDKSTAAFYAGKMLTSNKEFILNTIRSMAKNSNIDADDIEYPLVAAKCQAGRFQDVYIAFAILKDSRLIPFAFSIARSAEASKIVEEEYNNFARNKGDEDVIQVCEVSSIDTLDGKVSAYTSRFENDSSEFQYTIVSLALGVQRAQGAIGLISNSRLKTKTILPPSYKKILRDSRKGIKELPDYSKALAGAISIFTKFYDPEARTMIKDFSLLAGDVNLPDSEIGEGDASRSAKLSRPLSELSFRLFAWRGNRQDVYSWHFLNYLFGLSYLSEDERDIVLKNEFGLAIIAGILEGLKYGLIKKYGIDKGIEKTKEWVRMYLEKLQEGKFTESVVFTKEVLNKFISSLDNDDLLARLAEGEKTNVFDIEVPDDVIASTRNTQERISAMRSVLFRTGFCYRVFSSDVLYLEEYIKELITEGNTDPKDWVEFYVMAKDLLPRIEKVAKEGLGMKKAEFFLREIGPLIGCLRESNPGLSQKLEIYANKLMSRLDSLLQCENIEKTYSEIDLDADDLVNYIKALLESKAIPEIRRIEQFL